MFGWLGCSLSVGLFCGGPTIQKCPTKNLRGWQIVTRLSERHGSCISLVIVIRTRNQELAKRLGKSPNRPVWTGVAVEAPKLRRSRVPSSRGNIQLHIVRRAIFSTSHPHHSLVVEHGFSTNAPVGQTVPRLAVWTVEAIGGDALGRSRVNVSRAWALSVGGPRFVAGQLSKSARQRISMVGESSRECLSATGHAFHW